MLYLFEYQVPRASNSPHCMGIALHVLFCLALATVRGKERKSKPDFWDQTGFSSFSWVVAFMKSTFVIFWWHWGWDNLFTLLKGTRTNRICSLECIDVWSITVCTSGTRHAGNCVYLITTANWTSLFLLDPLPTTSSLSLYFFSLSLFLIFFPPLLEI